MGTVKVVQISNKLQDRRLGRHTLVQIQKTPNPLQRKQWIKATVTLKPATFTEKAVVETELFFMPFMEAVQKAQTRWPNKPISYQTLPVTAAMKTPEAASPEKAK